MGMVLTSRVGRAIATVAALLVLGAAAQAATLQVTVTDKASGAAISKATVALVSGGNVVAAGRTDGNGVWTGPAGDGWVVVDKKLYAPAARQVNSGQGALSIALDGLAPEQFKSLGRIVGFVKSSAGQPLGNATLVMLRESRPVGVTQTQNASGVYELEWYAPGTYTVLGTAPGFASRSYPDQKVTAGQALWLEVILQPR